MAEKFYNATNIRDIWVIRPTGELDMTNATTFKEDIKKEFVQEGKVNIILDLSSVNYIDSTGLGVLISLQRSCRMGGGALVFCGLENNLKRILKMTSLDSVFTIRESLEEALKVFLEG